MTKDELNTMIEEFRQTLIEAGIEPKEHEMSYHNHQHNHFLEGIARADCDWCTERLVMTHNGIQDNRGNH